MEILLTIVVASAVIFFGALISMGNERQRKAIDGLREQVVLWALQDLKIKREQLAPNVVILDPLEWFNKMIVKVSKRDIKITTHEIYENPQSIIFLTANNSEKIIITSASPTDIKRIKHSNKNRISQIIEHNPILFLPKDTTVYKISIFDEDLLFDVEFSKAWKALTNQNLINSSFIWIYLVPIN